MSKKTESFYCFLLSAVLEFTLQNVHILIVESTCQGIKVWCQHHRRGSGTLRVTQSITAFMLSGSDISLWVCSSPHSQTALCGLLWSAILEALPVSLQLASQCMAGEVWMPPWDQIITLMPGSLMSLFHRLLIEINGQIETTVSWCTLQKSVRKYIKKQTFPQRSYADGSATTGLVVVLIKCI